LGWRRDVGGCPSFGFDHIGLPPLGRFTAVGAIHDRADGISAYRILNAVTQYANELYSIVFARCRWNGSRRCASAARY
jgi:hypothetical protein